MVSISKDKKYDALLAAARAAEPYPAGHPLLDQYDGEPTEEEQKRIDATVARAILTRAGISWEE